MKITEIRLWGFQCFGMADGSAMDSANPKPVSMQLDKEISALIGRNGSGKSALLTALVRMFGETREERTVQLSDFFVPPGETLESVASRNLFIEVVIEFPELAAGKKGADETVPANFKHMSVGGPGETPFARIRLEATWQATGTLDGSIEDDIYWLITSDPVPFGETVDPAIKRRMSAGERANIAVRYIPASRDVTALTKLTVRSLGRNLMSAVQWSNEKDIRSLIAEAGKKLDAEAAFARVNDAINKCWVDLNAADTATTAKLAVLPPDFQQIVRAASIVLSPAATGRDLGIEHLSDGQRSLFHFALVKGLLDLKLGLEREVKDGETPPFSSLFMRAPALTVFCFEEPENHLAPYFLSRLLTQLKKLSDTQRVQALVTSHSPSIVGRLNAEAIRHLRMDPKTGVSLASKLDLPSDKDEAGKFVREAVHAHPEIYFARHAIFGEGASEQIVLPRLAEALGTPIDRSFVAIVPIEGRYIQHFWRLVTQLGIPSSTLMDLDLGRSSGDLAQFKAAAEAILAYIPPADPTLLANLNTTAAHTRAAGWNAAGWTWPKIDSWAKFFEQFGVFFSSPLDLDLAMLEAFPDAYKKLPPGAHGPQNPDDAARQKESAEYVLGKDGFGVTAYDGADFSLFPWYSYLFLGRRGKPAVHLSALANISDTDLAAKAPAVIRRLVKRVADNLDSPTP
ncbi:AAA family ATPase [Mesorhizobium sp. M0041]|uniref:AAA family ATPase n=1 Tax=Mesorhizobium sp. M0041 TaxID=2956856 RepID=UPI0033358DD4